jgi:arginase
MSAADEYGEWDEAPAEDEPVAEPPSRRPLGSAPLLDSEPLPATRPGMLRPRPAEEEESRSGGFSLPVQRPAFDLGSGEPADIA